MGNARRAAWVASLLVLLSLLALLAGASAGSTGLTNPLRAAHDPVAWQIVSEIRLPRTIGAWLCGALLGLAGAVAQGLFRNPLADPFLLGSASGAVLAVALLLAFGHAFGAAGGYGAGGALSPWLAQFGITGAAFVGALGGVLLTLVLARGVQHTLRLLLAGVVVGYVLGAVKDLVGLAAPDILRGMLAFSLGNTGLIGWRGCAIQAAALLPLLLLAWVLARVLDALALGEPTAQSLGLPLGPMRALLVGVVALATGTAVAQAGLIGFVGLVSPHLVRALARLAHGPLLWLSALMGGLLLAAADVVARVAVAPQELPVGVLTAVFGGGYLLWLMYRNSDARAVP
ncbi:MAG: iron(III) dicitrate transport system permease protein FecD [Burkholderiaceae bacterium]|jgi:iron complex transport system permease protein|nr:MAG: iron(III) dicitrate transport system permease protein FecD [Burkholderiaceae bacterium]